MKIKCNTRCLNSTFTGVQRYTTNLLKLFPSNQFQEINPSKFLSHGILGHSWEQFVLPNKIDNKSLLWSPSNTGPINISNQIITIHDTLTFDHPEWVSQAFGRWYRFMQPRLARQVKHIITISEFTKARMVALWNINPNKITTIYNGVDLQYFQSTPGNLKLPFDRYILVLGSIEPRKNIHKIIRAWNNIKNKVPKDIGLVIVGKITNASLLGDVTDRTHFTGHIKDEYIPSLYKNAIFFCYLSLYEGFGLPPLEAMAANCPTLVSNTGALKEVVGDFALTINPYNQHSIENAMLQYISDEGLRNHYKKLGFDRAQYFSWHKSAEQTWSLLENFS